MATINGSIFGDRGVFGLSGTTQADVIDGHEGDDWLFGDEGNDTLIGGTGADFMDGGGGNDTYFVDNANDRVAESADIGGGGIDTVNAAVSYRLPGAADYTTPGGAAAEGDNRIENLRLMEVAGAINGTGNEYDNSLWGNSAANTLSGGDGKDDLFGDRGADTLLGGAGDDRLFGGDQNDDLQGGANNDELFGGNGNDTLDGGEGDDKLFGQADYDILIGGSGRDTLDNGEEMYGGFGDDTYIVRTTGLELGESPDGGLDGVFSFVSFELPESIEGLVLEEDPDAINGFGNGSNNIISGNDYANDLRGFDGRDTLVGGGGNDTLRGGNHDDTLIGLDGDDTLRGDGGNDMMEGGLGDDDYFVNSLDDVVLEFAGEGFDDTVFSSQTDGYTLVDAPNVENLVLSTGTSGFGNNLANEITGNITNNILDGGTDQGDTMIGGRGDDTYFVEGFVGDVVTEFVGQGFDVVIARATARLTPGSELEVLQAFDNTTVMNLFGNEFSNQIRGNDTPNMLVAGGTTDSDTLIGLGGNDTYVIDSAGDQIIEQATGGTADLAIASISVAALAANVENVTLSGSANLNANGNGLGNIMQGNSGRNTLDGGSNADEIHGGGENDFLFGGSENDQLFGDAGVDRLVGASGFDIMTGGTGQDTFEFRSTEDSSIKLPDQILDFVSARFSTTENDKIDLSQIDADVTSPDNQDFLFIGNNNDFSASLGVGQLRCNGGFVEGDVNGDLVADFRIQVFQQDNLLAREDFIGVL
jgi:Ca2+-binding RTX toxin-like protein